MNDLADSMPNNKSSPLLAKLTISNHASSRPEFPDFVRKGYSPVVLDIKLINQLNGAEGFGQLSRTCFAYFHEATRGFHVR